VRARCRGQKFYCRLLTTVNPEYYHRARSGWNWAAHAVDWLGNRRPAGKYEVLLFGDGLGRRLHFARLHFRRCNYVLTRICECRCAKRQRDKRDAASSHPTNQAGQPEWCFHISIMQYFRVQHNDNRRRFSSRYCQRKCSSRNCPRRAFASSLRGPLATTNFS
jgi:hypothetical protein